MTRDAAAPDGRAGAPDERPDGVLPSGDAGPSSGDAGPSGDAPRPPARRERRQVLLRIDPAVHEALARWAADDLRSVNAQIDLLLRRALQDAGRMPGGAGAPARRGRPPAPS